MPDEVQNNRNSAAQHNRGREHISEQRNTEEKYNHRGGENDSTNVSADRYLNRVNFCAGKAVFHGDTFWRHSITKLLSLKWYWLIVVLVDRFNDKTMRRPLGCRWVMFRRDNRKDIHRGNS